MKYMSGLINRNLKLCVFKNTNKTNPNAPDYRAVLMYVAPRDENGGTTSTEEAGTDVPF